jgi:replicative DNA helicase
VQDGDLNNPSVPMSTVFDSAHPGSRDARDDDVARLRVPPQSIEAEQSVLGGLLLDNGAWDRAADVVTESDFYRYEHRLIFGAIGALISANKPADVITAYEQLQTLGKAEESGGLSYLNALAQSVPSAANMRRYAEIVRERAILRKLIAASDEIATQAFNPQGRAVAQILDEAEGRIFKIGEEGARTRQGFQSMDVLTVQLIDRVTELAENGAEDVTGVRTGFYDLDRNTAGLQPGDLVVLAARPSMGKAQPLDARVRTRTGWKRMGELEVGDALASIDGQPSIVTGVFPQGEKPVWRITFSDGRSTECCDEHLWRVRHRAWEEPRVLGTGELRAMLGGACHRDRPWIDLAQGRFGHDEPLPIDPWLLGCRLGAHDVGGLAPLGESAPDGGFLQRAVQPVGRSMEAMAGGPFDDRIAPPCAAPSAGVPAASSNPDRAAFEKYIPRRYLEADRDRRLDLLRGLLDTRGCIDRRGDIRIRASGARLAQDIAALVRSIGGWCSVKAERPDRSAVGSRRMPGSHSWVCHIVHPEPRSLLRSPAKRERTPERRRRPKRLAIARIEPTRTVPCQCIAVSHPSHLYITDQDVVTHNTAFALNIAENVSVQEGLPVVVFSMEMGASQLALRMVGSQGRIDQQHLRTGRLSHDEWGRLTEAVERLSKSAIFIDETPALSGAELRARARRQARQCGKLGLIVIDYLQLMSGSNSDENRATELGEISRGLKALAKELQCPVIALSQLNRSVETRNDKRPMMSDLRESGAIEQDADVIMFIYRDDYYNKESKEPGVAEIIIGKQRNGPVGTVKLTFLKQWTKFDNLAPEHLGGEY